MRAAQCLCAQQYPAHWWTPVPEANKPDWEILPQAAKPGEVILSKRNELGILSNFRGHSIHSVWQALRERRGILADDAVPGRRVRKFDDPRAKFPGITWTHTREEVAQMTAFDAKNAGELGEKNMQHHGYRLGNVRSTSE